MKKSLIISANSLTLALMPIMGVFAATGDPAQLTDNLSVTVTEICTFTRTDGDGDYADTMAASAYDASFATSTFKAVCNADDGYTVKAVFTALAGSQSGSIPYSTTAPAAGYNRWSALKNSSIMENNSNLISTNTADTSAGTSATVLYRVSTAADIAQGSYVGTATYTLTQN